MRGDYVTGNIDIFDVYKEKGGGGVVPSIRDLTVDILNSAGAYREGNKNIFERDFDEVLLARWIYSFRAMFIGASRKYYGLESYLSDIVYDTTRMFFLHVDINCAKDDESIVRYVESIALSRLRHCIKKIQRSRGIVKEKYSGKHYKGYSYKSLLVPLDTVDEGKRSTQDIYSSVSVVNEIADIIQGDKWAEIVLSACLRSRGKLNLRAINRYVSIPKEDQTEETKVEIARAYNKIVRILCKKLQRKTIREKKPCQVGFVS